MYYCAFPKIETFNKNLIIVSILLSTQFISIKYNNYV